MLVIVTQNHELLIWWDHCEVFWSRLAVQRGKYYLILFRRSPILEEKEEEGSSE